MEAHFIVLKAGRYQGSGMAARKFVFHFAEQKLVLYNELEQVRRTFTPQEVVCVKQDEGGLRVTITFKGGGSYSSKTLRPVQFTSSQDIERFMQAVAKFTNGAAQLIGVGGELLNNQFSPKIASVPKPGEIIKKSSKRVSNLQHLHLTHRPSRGGSATDDESQMSDIEEEEDESGSQISEDDEEEDIARNDNGAITYFSLRMVNRFGILEEKNVGCMLSSGKIEVRSLAGRGNWNAILDSRDVIRVHKFVQTSDIALGFGKHHHHHPLKGRQGDRNNSDSSSDDDDDDDDEKPLAKKSGKGKKAAASAPDQPVGVGLFSVVAWLHFSFANEADRQKFLDILATFIPPNSVFQIDLESEDAFGSDRTYGWQGFSVVQFRPPNSRMRRAYMINVRTRELHVLKSSQVRDRGISLDSVLPIESFTFKPSGVQCEMLFSKKQTRMRWGIIRSQSFVASRDEMADVTFDSALDCFRFVAALRAASAPVPKILVPRGLSISIPSLTVFPSAKYQRLAWTSPAVEWFRNTYPLFIGTLNAGDASPPKEFLMNSWVPKPQMGKGARLYVFGLQECPKFDEWVKALHNQIGTVTYKIVTVARLWEIGLVVFAHIDELKYISMVDTSTEATGVAIAKNVTGMQLGNKGGVAAGFMWHDTSLCFVSSHLAARQDAARERNRDAAQILSKITLSSMEHENVEFTYAYEHVFLFGDLNYRSEIIFKDALTLVAKSQWSKLNQVDQLRRERAAGRVFDGWDLAPTNFTPTYRWKRNRKELSNKNDQPPSYCDRVLWFSRPGLRNNVTLLTTNCVEELMVSDHRPVFATFELTLREPYLPWPWHPLIMDVNFSTEIKVQQSSAQLSQSMQSGAKGSSSASSDHSSIKDSQLPLQAFTAENDPNFKPDPKPLWLGNNGSFVYDVDESISTFAPEIRLENIVIQLEKNEDTGAPAPPTWISLRFLSRILHPVDPTIPTPGSEIHPDEVKPGAEIKYAYANNSQPCKRLFYQWKSDDGKPLPKLMPKILDPCYLVSHHITVAVEQASSRDERAAAAQQVLTVRESLGNLDLEDSVSSNALIAGRPSTGSFSQIKKRQSLGARAVRAISGSRTTTLSASSRPTTLSGSNASLVGGNERSSSKSTAKGGPSSSVPEDTSADVYSLPAIKSNPNIVGQSCIPLRYVIDAIRRGGAANLQKPGRAVPSVPFSEAINRAGIRIGTITGEIQFLLGDCSELRRITIQRKLQEESIGMINVVKSGMVEIQTIEPQLSQKKSSLHPVKVHSPNIPLLTPSNLPVPLQLDQVPLSIKAEQTPLSWQKMWIFLTVDGILYFSTKRAPKPGNHPKPPPSTLRRVIDISAGGQELFSGTNVVEVSGDVVFDSRTKTIELPRVIIRIRDEKEAKSWAQQFQAIQLKKNAVKVAATAPAIQPESFSGAAVKKTPISRATPSNSVDVASVATPAAPPVSGEVLIGSLVNLLKTGFDPAKEKEKEKEKETYYVPPPPPE